MNKFQIEELNLYYGQFHALKNINMGLESGGITAFIGPSGCGKSTLLKTLNRMNDLVEGCRIEGRRWTPACCASAWAWFSKSQTPSR